MLVLEAHNFMCYITKTWYIFWVGGFALTLVVGMIRPLHLDEQSS